MFETKKGEYIYHKIKNLGYNLVFISNKLKISKKKLMNILKNEQIDLDTISQISMIINFDLERDYNTTINEQTSSEILQTSKIIDQHQNKLSEIKLKYNALLDFIISLAKDYKIKKLKKYTFNHLKKIKTKEKK